jgi:hypothetical protein
LLIWLLCKMCHPHPTECLKVWLSTFCHELQSILHWMLDFLVCRTLFPWKQCVGKCGGMERASYLFWSMLLLLPQKYSHLFILQGSRWGLCHLFPCFLNLYSILTSHVLNLAPHHSSYKSKSLHCFEWALQAFMVPSGFVFMKEQSPGVFLLNVVPLLFITKALISLLNV